MIGIVLTYTVYSQVKILSFVSQTIVIMVSTWHSKPTGHIGIFEELKISILKEASKARNLTITAVATANAKENTTSICTMPFPLVLAHPIQPSPTRMAVPRNSDTASLKMPTPFLPERVWSSSPKRVFLKSVGKSGFDLIKKWRKKQ